MDHRTGCFGLVYGNTVSIAHLNGMIFLQLITRIGMLVNQITLVMEKTVSKVRNLKSFTSKHVYIIYYPCTPKVVDIFGALFRLGLSSFTLNVRRAPEMSTMFGMYVLLNL